MIYNYYKLLLVATILTTELNFWGLLFIHVRQGKLGDGINKSICFFKFYKYTLELTTYVWVFPHQNQFSNSVTLVLHLNSILTLCTWS